MSNGNKKKKESSTLVVMLAEWLSSSVPRTWLFFFHFKFICVACVWVCSKWMQNQKHINRSDEIAEFIHAMQNEYAARFVEFNERGHQPCSPLSLRFILAVFSSYLSSSVGIATFYNILILAEYIFHSLCDLLVDYANWESLIFRYDCIVSKSIKHLKLRLVFMLWTKILYAAVGRHTHTNQSQFQCNRNEHCKQIELRCAFYHCLLFVRW